MEKVMKGMLAVSIGLWLVCLVLGCLSSTGHLDWKVETKENVECVDVDADTRSI